MLRKKGVSFMYVYVLPINTIDFQYEDQSGRVIKKLKLCLYVVDSMYGLLEILPRFPHSNNCLN